MVLNFSTGLDPAPEQVEALLGAVRAGAGFVGLHAATATFLGYPDYLRMVGGRFRRHDPIKRFTIRFVDRDHPISVGLEDYEHEDELYELTADVVDRQNDVPLEGVRVLAEAEGHPMVYVKEFGAGRVAYLASGHDERSLGHPTYRTLFARAVDWAASRGLSPPRAPRRVRRGAGSAVEHGQVDPPQPLRIGEGVDLHDPPVRDGEAHHRGELPLRGDDDAGGAVDQRRPARRGRGGRRRAPGRRRRARAHDHRRRRPGGAAVRAQHDVRIEHGDEGVEVAAGRRRRRRRRPPAGGAGPARAPGPSPCTRAGGAAGQLAAAAGERPTTGAIS